jgi:hypothetical protein
VHFRRFAVSYFVRALLETHSRIQRLTVKFRNNYSNSKPGRKAAAAAGNLAVHRLLSNIVTGPTTTRKRPLKESEVYAKMYYASQVQASIKDELNAIKEHADAPGHMDQKHIDHCWKNVLSLEESGQEDRHE